MKKSLKGQTLVYQIRSNEQDSIFIGTRHWMLRVQFTPDQLKKDLANVGLFTEGAVNNGQTLGTPPNVENIFPTSLDNYNQLTKTPYLIEIDKTLCRVFLLPDGTNVLANDAYVSEIEAQFQGKSKSPLMGWSTKGPFDPIVYGNRLALVLPIRTTKTNTPYQLKSLSYAEGAAQNA